MATASGLNDFDYQSLTTLSMGLKNLNQIETSSKIPIPPEVMEHFNRKFSSINVLGTFVKLIVAFCFRHKLPLYDGTVSRDWTRLVNNRFGYLCE